MGTIKIEVDFIQMYGDVIYKTLYLPSIPRLNEEIEFEDYKYRVEKIVWVIDENKSTFVRMKATAI